MPNQAIQPAPEQFAVIQERSSHTCTTAIPGSGKTTLLVCKTVEIVDCGESVTAVTYTKQAALELENRVNKQIGKAAGLLTVGTFHGLVIKALKDKWDSPLHRLRIAGTTESEQFMLMALEQHGLDINSEN